MKDTISIMEINFSRDNIAELMNVDVRSKITSLAELLLHMTHLAVPTQNVRNAKKNDRILLPS